MGSVSMIKLTETDAALVHIVRIVRTDRVGLFPGFCVDNFPFVLAQLGNFTQEQFLQQTDIKYEGWVSHHLGMQAESEVKDFGSFRP
jgi:hypothetical protein